VPDSNAKPAPDDRPALGHEGRIEPSPGSQPAHRTPFPQHPTRLPGSKWSATHPLDRECHWQCVEFASRSGMVTLQAILTGRKVTLHWRELRQRDQWIPGWSQ
jgi:tryptophan-rich hypothetical protein